MRTADHVKETTRSVGTGTVRWSGPAASCSSTLASAFAVRTDRIAYLIVDLSGNNDEWASGTLIGIDALSRDVAPRSVNAGLPVAFAAGSSTSSSRSQALRWRLTKRNDASEQRVRPSRRRRDG